MQRSQPLWQAFLMVILAAVSGCKLPSQMVWSPDGSAAAYRVDDRTTLIDADGKVITSLGASIGGFAWSADSKTLYHTHLIDQTDGTVLPEIQWRTLQTPAIMPDEPGNPSPSKVIDLLAHTGGKSTSLIKFTSEPVCHLAISPDQQWIVMVVLTRIDSAFGVYVFHLPSKRLFVLSEMAGFGVAFTGPNRLVYVEPDRQPDKLDHLTGKLVEVTLDEKSQHLDRTPLLDILPDQTPWIAAIGDNLLLSSIGRAFPGKPLARDSASVCKLYMWTRANGGIVSISDDVGPLFAPSPDGQRVLIEKITPKNGQTPAKRELVMIRANGSDGSTLRDLSQSETFAMWPAWRGNDQIAFTAPEGQPTTVGKDPAVAFPVVLYSLTDKNALEPVKTLSQTWEPTMMPYVLSSALTSTTQPTTQSTIQP